MEKTNCGNCNWHDEVKEKRTYCLIDDQWYDVSHSCENFVKYSYMNREERSNRAIAFRKRLEDEAKGKREKEEAVIKEQREREFAEQLKRKDREHAEEIARKNREHAAELARLGRKHDADMTSMKMAHSKKLWRASFWWQLILVIISAGLGVGGTLIIQAILK